jgi:Nidogen-like
MSIKNPVTRISIAALSVVTLSVAMTGVASAAAIRSGFDANFIPRNDDGSAPITPFGFDANLFGTTYSQGYVNNNGNITFGGALPTFTPFALRTTTTPIIAAFFADVDTRNPATSPVTYGQGTVDGRNAFAANYRNVGYYSNGADKINDFQIVLIDRANTGAGNFDIEFNYDRIQWETGAASGGTGGLGGSSARVGYSNGQTGTANASFELTGSAVNGAFLDRGPAATSLIANSLNSDVLGRYIFGARNGEVVRDLPPVIPPAGNPNEPISTSPTTAEPTSTSPTTAVPEPADMLGTALAGLALIGLKRKMSKQAKL